MNSLILPEAKGINTHQAFIQILEKTQNRCPVDTYNISKELGANYKFTKVQFHKLLINTGW